MNTIQENLTTPISYECDVLVAGGGFGGIAAAIAAAREGKNTILVDRGFMLGGLATAGLVTIYLPICDGCGKQVSFGLAEELLRLSVDVYLDGERGAKDWIINPDTVHNDKTPRFEVNFNPNLFAIRVEQLLNELGVKILYGTYAVGAVVDNNKITAVIAENKSGRFAIQACSYVDATGDCDIAQFSGTPTERFGRGNVMAAWYYYHGKTGYGLNMLGFCEVPDELKNQRVHKAPLVERRFSGLDGEEVSEFMQISHEQTFIDVMKRRENDPEYQPTTIATIPQLRMTRRISGEYTLSETEKHKYFEDSIGMVSDWRRRGPIYEVPFRTLYSADMKNLVCAGRCTSVTDAMWDIMRVIPCCAVTGEAAGVAAAMSDDFTTINIKELQAHLQARGVKIHESDIT